MPPWSLEPAGEADPAASLGLEGTAEEDAAAAKLQAIQRGRQDRARVASMKEDGGGAADGGEDDPAASLGLEGTAEEDAAAAKLQAIQRGRQDRARVASMKDEEAGGAE